MKKLMKFNSKQIKYWKKKTNLKKETKSIKIKKIRVKSDIKNK
jgi:hypothetical protein